MSSLQIGPQYYPPRPLGAQIIRRGPHGMRFSQGPQPKPGGGFTWWDEQMVASGASAQKWTPEQVVTGVLGLGGWVDENGFRRAYQDWRSVPASQVTARMNAYLAAKNRWSQLTVREKSNMSAEMQTMALAMNDSSVRVSPEVLAAPEVATDASLTASRQRLVDARAAAARAKARGGENVMDHLPSELSRRASDLFNSGRDALTNAGGSSWLKVGLVTLGLFGVGYAVNSVRR